MNYGATNEKDVGTKDAWNYPTYKANGWGSSWEVATAEQWQELMTECIWMFDYDDIQAYSIYKVYKKKSASDDTFVLFLPDTYDEENDPHLIIPVDGVGGYSDDEGYYWPKTVYETMPEGQEPNVIRLYSANSTTTWTLESGKPTQHPIRLVYQP